MKKDDAKQVPLSLQNIDNKSFIEMLCSSLGTYGTYEFDLKSLMYFVTKSQKTDKYLNLLQDVKVENLREDLFSVARNSYDYLKVKEITDDNVFYKLNGSYNYDVIIQKYFNVISDLIDFTERYDNYIDFCKVRNEKRNQRVRK